MTQFSQSVVERQQIIRQFYEQQIEEQGYFIDGFVDLGKFAGATRIAEDKKPTWWDRPIDGNDFNGGAPKWSEYTALAIDDYKRWSEKKALSTEQNGNITRLVMFTQESIQNM